MMLSPSSCCFLRLMYPKIGVAIVEMMKTATRIQTMMEGLPVAATTLSVANIPPIEPSREKVEIQQAQVISRQPLRKLIRHVLIVPKSTRNMPVAPELFGCTPKASRAGLQIDPPPRPRAPATSPPIKPIRMMTTNALPCKITSPSRQLTPYLTLTFYSATAIRTATQVMTPQTQTKRN